MRGLDPTAEAKHPEGLEPQAAVPDQSDGVPFQDGLEVASDEEQELYETFTAMGLIGIYGKDSRDQLSEIFKRSDDLVNSVAEVSSAVALRVFSMAKDSGVDIPGEIVLHGGKEIVEAAVEMAEAATGEQFTPQMMEEAYLAAADQFAMSAEQAGYYGQDVREKDFVAISKMKSDGRIDKILEQMTANQQDPAEEV